MALSWSNQPPQSRVPYAIPQLEGERITIPGSKGVFRILASSKQTNGLMAVFQSGAVLSDAPGFHYHNHAHDVFLVTKGYLKLWSGDKCRIMGPGDFAYVPPVCSVLILEVLGYTDSLDGNPQPRNAWAAYGDLWLDHTRRLGGLLPLRVRTV